MPILLVLGGVGLAIYLASRAAPAPFSALTQQYLAQVEAMRPQIMVAIQFGGDLTGFQSQLIQVSKEIDKNETTGVMTSAEADAVRQVVRSLPI